MHILVLRPGAVGDTLLTFPILQYLHKKYHPAQITFIGNVNVLPLARAFGLAQTIANYEEPQWGQFFVPLSNPPSKKASRLQETARQMDMAIFWLHDPDTTLMQNAYAMGIKQVILAPGRPTEDTHMHIVTYLGQSIGAHIDIDTAWQVPEQYAWYTTPATLTKSRTIAIHPGSGGTHKCWPIAYFTTLIEQLWQHEIPILLLAGPADHERIAEIDRQLSAPPQTTLLRTLVDAPLLTVARQLRECRGYIGNDSGITHLAALLGLPTLALFGPSNPEIWRPIGSHVSVLYEPFLAQLAVDSVLTCALSFPL